MLPFQFLIEYFLKLVYLMRSDMQLYQDIRGIQKLKKSFRFERLLCAIFVMISYFNSSLIVLIQRDVKGLKTSSR